jgi:hypothetical protein
MKPSSSRWTSTLTGIALVALPLTCFAQAQPPAAPPSAQTEQQAAAPADANQVAAKAHLTAARNTLSQLTQLPAAGQLQGEARAQVSQLINNFNELITTQTDWKASYAKVAANLESLIGPSPSDAARPTGTAGTTGTPGAVGTSGTTGMAAIDPAVRAKLTEFRSELDEFQKAAQKAMSGSAAAPAPSAAPSTAGATPTPSAAPSEPAPTSAPSSAPSAPPAATSPAPGTERTTAPTAPEKAVEDPQTPDSVNLNPQDILQHIEAMEVIINAQSAAQGAAQAAPGAVTTATTPSGSTRTTVTPADVTLNQAQIAELKNHLAELRRLVDKK